MTDLKALCFDKDGTLFDFAATWEVWAEAFLTRACGDDRDRAGQVGRAMGFDVTARRFDPDSPVIAGTPEDVLEILQPLFPEVSGATLIAMLNEEAERAPQYEAVPLAALMQKLRAMDLRLGVATNDSEQAARAHLRQSGVEAAFDFIAGYDSGHGGKPAPGQLLAFAGQVGLDPSQVAMIGDSTHDLHAGRAAGMVTVAVLTGLAPPEVLAPHADVVLPDIGHLPGWLAGRSAR